MSGSTPDAHCSWSRSKSDRRCTHVVLFCVARLLLFNLCIYPKRLFNSGGTVAHMSIYFEPGLSAIESPALYGLSYRAPQMLSLTSPRTGNGRPARSSASIRGTTKSGIGRVLCVRHAPPRACAAEWNDRYSLTSVRVVALMRRYSSRPSVTIEYLKSSSHGNSNRSWF